MNDVMLVAAVARNGVIGSDGDIPWHLPEDLKRFKQLTMGGALIMGRKTFDSIGRPLPGRQNIVVTRNPDWRADGVTTTLTLDDALTAVEPGRTPFVIGGGEIYRLAMSLATRLEITHVDLEPAGDATFPVVDPSEWTETASESHDGFRYVTYGRRAGS